MKIISWNINGLRSAIKQDFWAWFKKAAPDILCLQEAKINAAQLADEIASQEFFDFENLFPEPAKELFADDAKNTKKPRQKYHYALHDAAKPGYSGVLTFSKTRPVKISTGLDDAKATCKAASQFNAEGRTLIFEYPDFVLLNCYFPNAQRDLARMDIKMAYNDLLLNNLQDLRKNNNIIVCGDFNVAHEEIDIKNAKSNRGNSGFTDIERDWFGKLLKHQYVDTFRKKYPNTVNAYTWWSNRPGVRERNIGWRIDYFVVNEEFYPAIKDTRIHPDVFGSDHCPIEMILKS